MEDFRGPGHNRLDLSVILPLSFVLMVGLIYWLDNAQATTSNGLYKAVTIRSWMADPGSATLDASNYLYYPSMALFCRLLDLIGVLPGATRYQLTIINAFFAAFCLGIVYLLVLKVTSRRAVAWAAAMFHLAGAFFLNLAISNEDIMPSYTILLASMALGAIWFVEPTRSRVAIVSAVFTLAWLFEWRLIFPTLPALLLALAIGPGSTWARFGRIVLFLCVMIGMAKVAILLWGPQSGNVGPVLELLWTGKGIDTGWAGFASRKLVFFWVGIAEYLVGGSNVSDPAGIDGMMVELLWATLCIAAIAIVFITILWTNRRSPGTRILGAIFIGTFLGGEVMNLYSQPQDPQMQINAMAWLTIGWALIVSTAARWKPIPILLIAMALSIALFSYNVDRLAPLRGANTAWRLSLEHIEKAAPPEDNIFLMQGFEKLVSEMYYVWGGDWTYFSTLSRAPSAKPRFKFLAFVNEPVNHPKASGQELAAALNNKIEHAMALGYSVIANDVWTLSAEQFASAMSTVLDAARAIEFHRLIHDSFSAVPAFSDAQGGAFFRLEPTSRK